MVFKYSTKLNPIKYCIAFRLYVPLQPFFIRINEVTLSGKKEKMRIANISFIAK